MNKVDMVTWFVAGFLIGQAIGEAVGTWRTVLETEYDSKDWEAPRPSASHVSSQAAAGVSAVTAELSRGRKPRFKRRAGTTK